MCCVIEGKVRLSVLKVHFCYDNTLCSILLNQWSDFDALTWVLKLLMSTLR